MPGKHKDSTIAFRPSAWAKALIEQRAKLSGMYKKDLLRGVVYTLTLSLSARKRMYSA